MVCTPYTLFIKTNITLKSQCVQLTFQFHFPRCPSAVCVLQTAPSSPVSEADPCPVQCYSCWCSLSWENSHCHSSSSSLYQSPSQSPTARTLLLAHKRHSVNQHTTYIYRRSRKSCAKVYAPQFCNHLTCNYQNNHEARQSVKNLATHGFSTNIPDRLFSSDIAQ